MSSSNSSTKVNGKIGDKNEFVAPLIPSNGNGDAEVSSNERVSSWITKVRLKIILIR